MSRHFSCTQFPLVCLKVKIGLRVWPKGDLKFSTSELTGLIWHRSELIHEVEKQMCVCRVIKQLSCFTTVADIFLNCP